ncbi:glycosyltransferase [Campylobacter lari]|uniref:glycosyltransferase n=1 Tax=Campylobacter lari TaxID=201 RepID=UPI0037297810
MKQEISSFWYTPKGYKGIGLMELLSIKSFLDNGYKFILYTYNLDDKIFNKLNEIFDDFELKDANEIISFEKYFSDDKGAGVAAFSDYFRFNMLYKRGGIWVDLDMICLNHIDLSQDYIFSQEVDEDETKPRITTSLLKFPKNSEFGKNLIIEAEKIINNQKLIKWGVIGPWFLEDWVKKCNLEHFAWDYKKTCQISYLKAKNFIDSSKNIDTTQPFLHLFSEIWRTYKLNKNYFYKNGIYGKLLKKI